MPDSNVDPNIDFDVDTLLNDFEEFIHAHKCETKEDTTHTILKKGGGKFCFEGRDYQEFLEQYIEIIKNDKTIDLHFVEKPNKNGVTYLFIDVDFDHKGGKRLYTQDHIKQIIEKTNDFLSENFIVTNYELISFVTEKPKPTKRDNNPNMYKDGFHIYYPFLPMDVKQRYYVLDHLSSLMIENEFLTDIDYYNDADVIFDMSIIKNNGILMFGSKKQGGYAYELTHVYDSEFNDLDTEEYDDEELVNVLSNQRYDVDGRVDVISDDVLDNVESVYQQYNGGNKKKKKNTRKKNYDTVSSSSYDKSNKSSKYEESRKGVRIKKRDITDERDIELAKELCKILSKKRAHHLFPWRRVGFALRAIDDSLYDSFVDFSKKDMSKYKEGKITCEEIWEVAKDYDQFYDIETIKYWARIDNPDAYIDILRKMNDDVFGQAESGQHVDIAEIVHRFYKGRFVCIDIEKNKWYEFQDHRWVAVQSAYTLENLISDDIRRILRQYFVDKMQESNMTKIGISLDEDSKKYMRLLKVIDKLGNVKERSSIIRACANKFIDDKFQAKLDSNVYLVGFTNGVYDLKEGCFRDGLPSDYVSKTVGYDWMEFEEDDPIFDKINKFFSEVQIEEDMRTYILTFIAKTLRGIPDSKLHIWTGGGGNGKSATVDLIQHMLGDYFGILPVSVLTKKRGGAEQATPAFADKNGKRFLVIQEPEHNDVIFVGQMKEYTGKDKLYARPLYGQAFEYVPQFTIVLTCNNLPYIPSTDNGTWRRLRVAPFDSEFVDENPTEPNQFLKDEDLQEDFPNWVQPLIWLIITKYYPIYEKGYNNKKFKIYEPAIVKENTDDYKLDSDMYATFLDETIERTNDKKHVELIDKLYKEFSKWYSAFYNDKAPRKATFTGYLKKKGYNVDKQKIYGVRDKNSLT